MLKKFICSVILYAVCFVSGCTISKQDLIRENTLLLEENAQIKDENQALNNTKALFDFYNKISTETVNSFVLIESKHNFTSQVSYSEGVIIASNGYDCYVLTDYNSLVVGRNVSYRVMNANAEVYSAQLLSNGGNVVYDVQTGFVLLRVRVNNLSVSKMRSVQLSDISDIFANISNTEQLNKIQIDSLQNVNKGTFTYDGTEFDIYTLVDTNKGSLVSINNALCGFYFSSLEGYGSSELIKKVAYATYSLIL